MKQKLLKTMIALIAIVMPNLSYAQSQYAEGTYNGTLNVKVGPMESDIKNENVYIIAEDANHIRLEIREFKFQELLLGDIIIPNAELQKEENKIIILPITAKLSLPDIGDVDVQLNKSTIVNKELVLTLSVSVPGLPLPVNVSFTGQLATGSGIYDTATEKINAYYNSATSSLIVKGAENQKYDIYNVTGVQTMTGIITSENINVSNLTKGIYLIKIGNNTVKFIKQ